MSQIISAQVGQCGNQIGTKFWEIISGEHGIEPNGTYNGDSPLQLEHIDVYFKEVEGKKYVPRAVLVDLEPATMNLVRLSTYGNLFQPDNFLFGKIGVGNNFARGYYTDGMDFIDDVMNNIRKEAEMCDSLMGFHLTHSLGGGTGSGLGALMIMKIREQYPNRMVTSFSVFPTPKASDVIVEPYNATLATRHLIENVDGTFCIDNTALRDISLHTLKLASPAYDDFNHIASMAMSGVTSFFRFPGQLNTDLHELAVNMIPLPSLHFLMFGSAPLIARNTAAPTPLKISQLIQQSFDKRNIITACDPKNGRYLTAAAMFRGQLSVDEVESQISTIRKTLTPEWLPNNIKLATCEIPTRGTILSAAPLFNNTAIQEILANIRQSFSAMFRRKAFLHWYTGEGMEEQEFKDANNILKDTITEYQKYEEMQDDKAENVVIGDKIQAANDGTEQ
ncbi:BEN-1 protein [Loa loa]|uniref:Tubulin beta chain n=3 Tax=Loa loa TaxID=7209 RepID=A0A1I7VD02_LOALO|nr:BEN-1 protein [Loa loa]EFO15952.1 BEN-1 protein [Loa loa]